MMTSVNIMNKVEKKKRKEFWSREQRLVTRGVPGPNLDSSGLRYQVQTFSFLL